MAFSRVRRLIAPALAVALWLAPALRLVCDTVCAEPPVSQAAHCSGGDPSDPAHGNPGGSHEQPEGCRHSADVVLAKASGGSSGGNETSLPVAELAPAFDGAQLRAAAFDRTLHRRPPPSAAARAPSVLRL